MGQQEVQRLLKGNKDWLSAREMAEKLKVRVEIIRRSLVPMRKYKEVRVKQDGNKFIYKLR